MQTKQTKVSKKEILSCKQWSKTDRYLLRALLCEDKLYSLTAVEKLLDKEKKRGIN